MNRARRLLLASAMVVAVATLSWIPPAAAVSGGVSGVAPPGSHAYGKTLTEWLSDYFRWYYGTAQDPAQSTIGHVLLMPLPQGDQVGGDGSPGNPAIFIGELDITLHPGTPFVLPLVNVVGETYDPSTGIPDDPTSLGDTAQMSVNLTIDGRTIVSAANQAAFFVPTTLFDPVVIYPEETFYGSTGAIWLTGIAVVGQPLSVGKHVIHLDATLILPGVFGEIFHNTWTVTVSPH